MCAKNATNPSSSATATAKSATAKPTMTTNALPVSVDSSLPATASANPWKLDAFAIKEDSAPTASPTLDSRAANALLRGAVR